MFLASLRHNTTTREIAPTGRTPVFDSTVSRTYNRIRRLRVTHDGQGTLAIPEENIGDWGQEYDSSSNTLTVSNASALPSTDVEDIIQTVEYVGEDDVTVEAEASFQAYIPINLDLLNTASSTVTAKGINEVCAPQTANTVFLGCYAEVPGSLHTFCIYRVTTSPEGETTAELVYAPEENHSEGAVFMSFGTNMIVWSYVDGLDDSYLRAARFADGSWTVGTALLLDGDVRFASTDCPTSTLETVAYIGTTSVESASSDAIRRVEVDLESANLITLGPEIALATNRIALINNTHYLVTEGTDTMHVIEASTGTITEHTVSNPATEIGEWINVGVDGLIYRCFGDGTDYSIYTCDPMATTPEWTLFAAYADDDYRIEDVAAMTDEDGNLQLTVFVQSKTVTADNFIAYASVVDGTLVLDSLDVSPRFTVGATVSYQKWIRGNAPLGGSMYLYRDADGAGRLDTLHVQGRGDGTNSISVRLLNAESEEIAPTVTPTVTPTSSDDSDWVTWLIVGLVLGFGLIGALVWWFRFRSV